MRKRLMASLWWTGVFFLLVTVQAGSLFAAEGTARLTFQKTILTQKKATYLVKRGDTIKRIMQRLGAAAPRLSVIKDLNPQIADLNKIYPGQRIVIAYAAEQDDSASETVKNYTVRKGDSLTRIIVSELAVPPDDVTTVIRYVWSMNPNIGNVNKIYPGQVLKIPEGRKTVAEVKETAEEQEATVEKEDKAGGAATAGEKEPAVSVDIPSAPPAPAVAQAPDAPVKEEAKPAALPVILPPANTLAIVSQIIRQLNGTMILSGNYYIPLPDAGQVTIDCATIPIAELDDGTTILLDFTKRLPDELATMIQANWKNYHLLKLERGEGVSSVLKKIMMQSKSYNMFTMAEAGKPLFIEDEPQVKLLPDWVINKNTTPGKPATQLALFAVSDNAQLLPRPVLTYAKKKGVNICEILLDKVQTYADEGPAKASPVEIPRIAGVNSDELLGNFFNFAGLESFRDKEVKIFDTAKDGFNLSIKADWLAKRGAKTAVIHKNKLPQQFVDVLRNQGMEPIYLVPGISRRNLLESVLTALGIPSQFALFSVPERDKKAKFAISFSALKIDGDKGQSYLTDFDMDRDIYELLKNSWKLNVVRY